MGSYITKHDPEHIACLPFICVSVDSPVSVDPNVTLEVRDSKLVTGFIPGRNTGLFTLKPIVKDTIILSVNMNEESKMNDGMVDLNDILQAETSEATYQAWCHLRKSYYDLEKMKQIINVRMVTDGTNLFYQALQDIPIGGELVRVYGFTSWIFEINEILTNKNIVGFAQFVKELSETIPGDPLEPRVKNLVATLNLMGIPHIYSIDRKYYDIEVKDVPVKYYKQ